MNILNDDTFNSCVLDRASNGHSAFSVILEKYSKDIARIYLEEEDSGIVEPGTCDTLVVLDDDGDGMPLPVLNNSYYVSWIQSYTIKVFGTTHRLKGTKAFILS